jgi:hypothetical protein
MTCLKAGAKDVVMSASRCLEVGTTLPGKYARALNGEIISAKAGA